MDPLTWLLVKVMNMQGRARSRRLCPNGHDWREASEWSSTIRSCGRCYVGVLRSTGKEFYSK